MFGQTMMSLGAAEAAVESRYSYLCRPRPQLAGEDLPGDLFKLSLYRLDLCYGSTSTCLASSASSGTLGALCGSFGIVCVAVAAISCGAPALLAGYRCAFALQCLRSSKLLLIRKRVANRRDAL